MVTTRVEKRLTERKRGELIKTMALVCVNVKRGLKEPRPGPVGGPVDAQSIVLTGRKISHKT